MMLEDLPMQDARYFRDQAALCLEIARQVSDRQLAEKLRLEAAQYLIRATELDSAREPAASPSRGEAAARH
jgi:hypothetical protein